MIWKHTSGNRVCTIAAALRKMSWPFHLLMRPDQAGREGSSGRTARSAHAPQTIMHDPHSRKRLDNAAWTVSLGGHAAVPDEASPTSRRELAITWSGTTPHSHRNTLTTAPGR